MALEWQHDSDYCPLGEACPGKGECQHFPTRQDRINMAWAAYREYAEADDTPLLDFVQDVELLARAKGLVQKVWVVTEQAIGQEARVAGVVDRPELVPPLILRLQSNAQAEHPRAYHVWRHSEWEVQHEG